jgi:hypothetical protein
MVLLYISSSQNHSAMASPSYEALMLVTLRWYEMYAKLGHATHALT